MTYMDEPITVDGIEYLAVENFFQAHKTSNRNLKIYISTLNPFESRKYGKKMVMRDNWDDIKLKIMEFAIDKKFNQPRFRDFLITVNEPIMEDNWWRDTFWGVYNNQGENHLGKILERKRDSLLEIYQNKRGIK